MGPIRLVLQPVSQTFRVAALSRITQGVGRPHERWRQTAPLRGEPRNWSKVVDARGSAASSRCGLLAASRHGCAVPELSSAQLANLTGYGWLGNARELRNVADRFVLGMPGRAAHVRTWRGRSAGPAAQPAGAGGDLRESRGVRDAETASWRSIRHRPGPGHPATGAARQAAQARHQAVESGSCTRLTGVKPASVCRSRSASRLSSSWCVPVDRPRQRTPVCPSA